MLSNWIRLIHDDNGTLTDYSLSANDRTSTFTLPIVAADDCLYIGQYFPFNNIFLSIGTANTNASVIDVQYWNNSAWVSMVDVLDGTSSSGKSMAVSGVIQWEVDRDESGWGKIFDPTDEGAALGFESLKIYDLYWVKIKFSADLSAGSTANQIGYKFCDTADLVAITSNINDYLESWETGRTDWNEQCLEASKQIVHGFKSRGIAMSAGQVLRFDEVNLPAVYKTLSIIYNGIGGKEYVEMRDHAEKTYRELIANVPVLIDRNENAKVDREEMGITQGRMIR